MSDDDNNKKEIININSTSTISTSVGGAVLGGVIGGPIGAVVGGIIGFAIGNPAFQEMVSEARAKVEINQWQEFFNSLRSDELPEARQSFAKILTSSSMVNSLKEWNLHLDNLSSDERRLLQLKRENYEVEKSLKKKREELSKLNQQILESEKVSATQKAKPKTKVTSSKPKKKTAKNKSVQTSKKGKSQ